MTRIRRDTLAYCVVAGFCVWLLAWAIPAQTPEYPGYGAPADLVPVVAACVMLVMVCVSLLRVAVAHYTNKPMPPAESAYPEDLEEGSGFSQVGRINLIHLAKVMIPCVLLVVAIEYIGYMLASFAFLMLLQFLIGARRWLQSIIVSAALVATLYVIMRYGFGVPVPGPIIF